MSTYWQDRVRALCRIYRAELQDEFGNFELQDLPDSEERVLLIPEGATARWEYFVCYLSDHHADARLVVDDYVPELADEDEGRVPPVPEDT